MPELFPVLKPLYTLVLQSLLPLLENQTNLGWKELHRSLYIFYVYLYVRSFCIYLTVISPPPSSSSKLIKHTNLPRPPTHLPINILNPSTSPESKIQFSARNKYSHGLHSFCFLNTLYKLLPGQWTPCIPFKEHPVKTSLKTPFIKLSLDTLYKLLPGHPV